jgi:iron complex transport system substrate-binding protein
VNTKKKLGGEKKKKMKTKKKMIAIVEIAIVLCSVFLVAIPAIAAEDNTQKVSASAVTTASADDYVLGIYGNANEDDTIDMGDVVYTKLAIFGKKPKTELCDAKYDGRINVLDIIQTKLIILGKEKEITIIDTLDRIVTVKKPLKRIIPTHPPAIEALRPLKVPKDIIVGIGTWPTPLDPVFFAEFSDVPCIGTGWNPDVEAILELNPDLVVLTALYGRLKPTADVLESAGIPVVAFKFQTPEVHREEVKTLGYIVDKEEEADEYRDWHEEIQNSIKDKVEKIPEEDKPKVYFETALKSGQYATHRFGGNFIKAGGGKNILEGMSGEIDTEAVIKGDPDIIVKLAPCTAGGYGVDADDTAEFKALREEIMSRPELQKVKAVEEGEVYILANHMVSFYQACGCRAFIGDAYFAKWLQPTLFEDLDPKTIHQEYLTRFQGLDIDLDEKGVFAYPEPS